MHGVQVLKQALGYAAEMLHCFQARIHLQQKWSVMNAVNALTWGVVEVPVKWPG